jgi:hypothetical protein
MLRPDALLSGTMASTAICQVTATYDRRGVHRGDRFRSPRAVDRKLDQRHQLVERLALWRTARESAGQIQRAEFDHKTPMQDVNVMCQHRAKLATNWIDAKIGRDAAKWMVEHNGAGNAKRPQPRQALRQIAEAFAEEQPRLDRIGRVGARRNCRCPT